MDEGGTTCERRTTTRYLRNFIACSQTSVWHSYRLSRRFLLHGLISPDYFLISPGQRAKTLYKSETDVLRYRSIQVSVNFLHMREQLLRPCVKTRFRG
ncbi:hypothetical protein PILCRDRAFT_380637 [Piloderma croceum F 1598]|uniref:Uncharacterized protein n=1 Tax=Piloderma croceum (strain F 1598) TaxID=765440 RepID=A0A0C3FZ61_PILCF|nr:hypothetical protein PILCRDRAFT_380637 [Piloderma croceum F 1598]